MLRDCADSAASGAKTQCWSKPTNQLRRTKRQCSQMLQVIIWLAWIRVINFIKKLFLETITTTVAVLLKNTALGFLNLSAVTSQVLFLTTLTVGIFCMVSLAASKIRNCYLYQYRVTPVSDTGILSLTFSSFNNIKLLSQPWSAGQSNGLEQWVPPILAFTIKIRESPLRKKTKPKR